MAINPLPANKESLCLSREFKHSSLLHSIPTLIAVEMFWGL